MQTIFVFVKCELGKTYEVAAAAVDTLEEVSEIHSISGEYELLMKCYVPTTADIGHFVTGKLQLISHVKDTKTIITFNAFT